MFWLGYLDKYNERFFWFYWAIRDQLSIKSSHVCYKFRSDPLVLEWCTCTEWAFYFLLNFQSGKSTLLLGLLLLVIILPQQWCWDRCTTAQDSRTPQTTSWVSLTTKNFQFVNFSLLLGKSGNRVHPSSFQVLRRWRCFRIYHKDRLVRQLYSPLRMYGAVPYVYHIKTELFPTGFPVKNPIFLQMHEW